MGGFLPPRTVGGILLNADRPLLLGRDSFKRTDDGSELMNVDGRAVGSAVTLWNGTGGSDTGGDWTHSGVGSEATAAAHAGTNGLNTGVTSLNDNIDFDNGSLVDVVGIYSEIRFWIQPKSYPNGSRFRIVWLDASNNPVGNSLRVDDYVGNMDLDIWQQISIPIADFELSSNVQKLRFRALNVAGQHYWIDDIELIVIGGGPYRFQFKAPDTNTQYHISMLVLVLAAPETSWNSSSFVSITGGLDLGLILRQRRVSTAEVLTKFVCRDNVALFGQYHPQEEVTFADNIRLFGFMVKPGKASIIVTDDDVLEFVVRDDLTDLSEARAYAHYGVEIIE